MDFASVIAQERHDHGCEGASDAQSFKDTLHLVRIGHSGVTVLIRKNTQSPGLCQLLTPFREVRAVVDRGVVKACEVLTGA
jgi:hypothetical protein